MAELDISETLQPTILKWHCSSTRKKVLPSVYRGLLNQFQKGSKKAEYPTVRSEIRTFNHPNGSVYFEVNNVFTINYPTE